MKTRCLVLALLFVPYLTATLYGADGKRVLLATTTSVYDTGLIDALQPLFERATSYSLKTQAVGSGRALSLGRLGEVDVLWVHAPSAERTFMEEGAGVRRRAVMHNYFVIVGPSSDPAGVCRASSATEAVASLAREEAVFLSRGDNSGTHQKERALLGAADVPSSGWNGYRETGQGMAATLRVADELEGYALSDIGTFLALKRTVTLRILFEKDEALKNPYSVIEVSGPTTNVAGARAFATFLRLPSTQHFIGRYGTDRYGRSLFVPDALAERP